MLLLVNHRLGLNSPKSGKIVIFYIQRNTIRFLAHHLFVEVFNNNGSLFVDFAATTATGQRCDKVRLWVNHW